MDTKAKMSLVEEKVKELIAKSTFDYRVFAGNTVVGVLSVPGGNVYTGQHVVKDGTDDEVVHEGAQVILNKLGDRLVDGELHAVRIVRCDCEDDPHPHAAEMLHAIERAVEMQGPQFETDEDWLTELKEALSYASDEVLLDIQKRSIKEILSRTESCRNCRFCLTNSSGIGHCCHASGQDVPIFNKDAITVMPDYHCDHYKSELKAAD